MLLKNGNNRLAEIDFLVAGILRQWLNEKSMILKNWKSRDNYFTFVTIKNL